MFSSQDLSEEKPTQDSILAECIEKFSYAKINNVISEQDAVAFLNWTAFPNSLSSEFVSLYKDKEIQGLERDDGLKLHISLANVEDNIQKGWDIVVRHIIKNNIINCKVVRDHLRNDMMTDGQSGKEITVYIYKNIEKSESDWEKIIQEITADLAENKIIPGPKPSSDFAINGCNYISHRGYRFFSQEELAPYEYFSDKEDQSPEEPKYTNSKDDGLLADTNLAIIQRARRAMYNAGTGIASDSSGSAPSSPAFAASESDTKSESTLSNEINLPFRSTLISVPNQLQRMSFKDLKTLFDANNPKNIKISSKKISTKKPKELFRITSISNFSSLHASLDSVSQNQDDVDSKNNRKLSR